MGDKKPQRRPGFDRKPSAGLPPMGMVGRKMVGEYITDLDMTKYLNYVVSTQPLKGVPAFDSYNVDGAAASGENGKNEKVNKKYKKKGETQPWFSPLFCYKSPTSYIRTSGKRHSRREKCRKVGSGQSAYGR